MAVGRIDSIELDCNDPDLMTKFWGAILGVEIAVSDEECAILPPTATVPHFCLLKVPEGKSTKNRMHLDIAVDDLDTAVAEAEKLGATRATGQLAGPFPWVVMHDPEGNEFCFIPPSHYMTELVHKDQAEHAQGSTDQ